MLMGLVFVSAGKASLDDKRDQVEPSQFARLPIQNYAETEFDFMLEIVRTAEPSAVLWFLCNL